METSSTQSTQLNSFLFPLLQDSDCIIKQTLQTRKTQNIYNTTCTVVLSRTREFSWISGSNMVKIPQTALMYSLTQHSCFLMIASTALANCQALGWSLPHWLCNKVNTSACVLCSYQCLFWLDCKVDKRSHDYSMQWTNNNHALHCLLLSRKPDSAKYYTLTLTTQLNIASATHFLHDNCE